MNLPSCWTTHPKGSVARKDVANAFRFKLSVQGRFDRLGIRQNLSRQLGVARDDKHLRQWQLEAVGVVVENLRRLQVEPWQVVALHLAHGFEHAGGSNRGKRFAALAFFWEKHS